jgi:hypothetical protein
MAGYPRVQVEEVEEVVATDTKVQVLEVKENTAADKKAQVKKIEDNNAADTGTLVQVEGRKGVDEMGEVQDMGGVQNNMMPEDMEAHKG